MRTQVLRGLATEPKGTAHSGAMADDRNLIGPDETAFRLELTPAQLKITHTALKSLLDDFGHEEHDVHDVITQVLDKLPDEHAIRAIDLRPRQLRQRAASDRALVDRDVLDLRLRAAVGRGARGTSRSASAA